MNEKQVRLVLAVALALYLPFLIDEMVRMPISAEQGRNLLVSGAIVAFMILVVKVINQPTDL